MPKFSIPQARIHLKKRKPNDKIGYLVVSLRFNHKQVTYSLTDYLRQSKLYPLIYSNCWDAKAGQTRYRKTYCEQSKEINDSLRAIKTFIGDLLLNQPNITHSELKKELDYFTGKDQRPEEKRKLSFFDFIDQFIKDHQQNGKRGTWKKFKTVQSHLKTYANEKGIVLDYEDIDWQFRNDFLQWLYSPPRNHATNNASKILAVTKRFLKESYKLKYHNSTTFKEDGFGEKRVKTKNKVRLSFSELKVLMNSDLSQHPSFEKVRDLFIVGCYTGLRVSDWHKVKKENIILNDGKEYLEIFTQKTSKLVVIPLLPELKDILERYNYQLPKISTQFFNRTIKEVCKLVGLDGMEIRVYSEGGQVKSERLEKYKMVSTHCARRSFASNFFKMGVSTAILMQITGHSTEKQFFEYIDLDQKELAKDFTRAIELNQRDKNLKIVS